MFYGIIVRVKTGGMFFLAVKEVAERWGLPLFLDSSGNETNGRCSQMFIDEGIGLRENLPERLQRDFAKLRKYYDEGDWFHFDIFFEGVEATVKGYYLAGKISRDDLNSIFRKYRIL